MASGLLNDTGTARRMQLVAELVGGVTVVERDAGGVAQVGAHAEIAHRDHGRAIVTENVGIVLLGLRERVERVLLAEGRRDLDTPARSGRHEVFRRLLTLEAGRERISGLHRLCLLYTSPSPRDGLLSRM